MLNRTPSAVSTVATTYGLSKPGYAWCTTDRLYKVARPLAARQPTLGAKQWMHRVFTGHMYFSHDSQNCRTSSDRAAPSKNGALASS